MSPPPAQEFELGPRLQHSSSIAQWKDPTIVTQYPNGCNIVMVRCTPDWKQGNNLSEFVDWMSEKVDCGAGTSGLKDSERIFLYLAPTMRSHQLRVLGCGMLEIPLPNEIAASDLIQNSGEGIRSIKIGITRLWTDEAFRGFKIATGIVDAMRVASGLPEVIAKSDVGILGPTKDGIAFMQKYTEFTGAKYDYSVWAF